VPSNKKADIRVWDIGHLSPIVHLLSKHGRYGRFQPCPDGLLPFPGKELGRGLGDSNFHLFLIDLLKKVKKGEQVVNIKLYETFVWRLRVTGHGVYMSF
jgi:hypothetical protein